MKRMGFLPLPSMDQSKQSSSRVDARVADVWLQIEKVWATSSLAGKVKNYKTIFVRLVRIKPMRAVSSTGLGGELVEGFITCGYIRWVN
jgi:hypothetical protein